MFIKSWMYERTKRDALCVPFVFSALVLTLILALIVVLVLIFGLILVLVTLLILVVHK